MPITFYLVVHLIGIMMLFMGLGGIVVRGMVRAKDKELGDTLKGPTGISHGIGLILILISGFGMLAKNQLGFPGWIMAKLVIWLVLGGLIAAMMRAPKLGKVLWGLCIVLGACAAYLAMYRPF